MPHIDAKTGEVIVRIVYDGAPGAGTSTNLAQLAHLAPGGPGGASAAVRGDGRFEWLDFAGGVVEGRRVRCQILAAGGGEDRAAVRRHLLERADSVVFVADSRPDAVGEAKAALGAMRASLPAVLADLQGGLVVQANRQDDDAALPAAELLERLGLADGAASVASVATTGRGVLDTFVLAARVATRRLRELDDAAMHAQPPLEPTPEALTVALRELETVERAKAEETRRARVAALARIRDEAGRRIPRPGAPRGAASSQTDERVSSASPAAPAVEEGARPTPVVAEAGELHPAPLEDAVTVVVAPAAPAPPEAEEALVLEAEPLEPAPPAPREPSPKAPPSRPRERPRRAEPEPVPVVASSWAELPIGEPLRAPAPSSSGALASHDLAADPALAAPPARGFFAWLWSLVASLFGARAR